MSFEYERLPVAGLHDCNGTRRARMNEVQSAVAELKF